MCVRQRFSVKDADLDQTVTFTRCTLNRVFYPLVEEIAAAARTRGERTRGGQAHGERPGPDHYLLALAGPPGCGKSTVAALLCRLLTEKGFEVFVLPLDGFHLKNEELRKRRIGTGDGELSLYERKGAKESYDVERLLGSVTSLRAGDPVAWPVYSRELHEPIEGGVKVREGGCICIIEGNYLLLDVEPWNRLRALFDKRIMIVGNASLMRKRIVSRKTRGGFTRAEAEAHFRRSDALNIAEVIERSAGYDLLLAQKGRYGLCLRGSKSGRRRRSATANPPPV